MFMRGTLVCREGCNEVVGGGWAWAPCSGQGQAPDQVWGDGSWGGRWVLLLGEIPALAAGMTDLRVGMAREGGAGVTEEGWVRRGGVGAG